MDNDVLENDHEDTKIQKTLEYLFSSEPDRSWSNSELATLIEILSGSPISPTTLSKILKYLQNSGITIKVREQKGKPRYQLNPVIDPTAIQKLEAKVNEILEAEDIDPENKAEILSEFFRCTASGLYNQLLMCLIDPSNFETSSKIARQIFILRLLKLPRSQGMEFLMKISQKLTTDDLRLYDKIEQKLSAYRREKHLESLGISKSKTNPSSSTLPKSQKLL